MKSEHYHYRGVVGGRCENCGEGLHHHLDDRSCPTQLLPRGKINHPSHYNQGKFEVIDVIQDWGLNFTLGNVVKYIARAAHKGEEIQDLQKARWYLNYEIDQAILRKEKESDLTKGS